MLFTLGLFAETSNNLISWLFKRHLNHTLDKTRNREELGRNKNLFNIFYIPDNDNALLEETK